MFISHANPEDNLFARWFGLQLTREGYSVWSDITKLIGGETFWAAVEDAIRNHTAKFVFVCPAHRTRSKALSMNIYCQNRSQNDYCFGFHDSAAH